MKLLLDEDLSPTIAEIARARGLDALSVHDIGRRGLPDDEQLAYAAAKDRVFVTRNRDDFLQLTVRFFHELRPHAGVVVVPSSLPTREPARVAAALAAWVEKKTQQGQRNLAYTFEFLSAGEP